MFSRKLRTYAFVLLFAVLASPVGIARAAEAASSYPPLTASSGSTSTPTIVSGTDPEPASPNIIQIILTILTVS